MSVAIIPMSQEFGWSSSVSGLIQSSFFWGFLLIQLPGGYLANRFGGKNVLPGAVSVWSIATAAVPPLATTIPSLCVSRSLVGLGEGCAPSASTDLIVRSVPENERARAVSISFGGLSVGSIAGLILSPLLIEQFGWESVFYIFGFAGLFWAFWFRSVVNDSAEDMVALKAKLQTSEETTGETTAIPWRAFMRNAPIRSLMFTHFCQNWCHYTMLAWLPTYFKTALNMDLTHASIAALLPPMASLAVSAVASQVVDGAISKGTKVAHVRKVAQCVAFLLPAACLIGASETEGTYASVAFITAALGFNAFSLSALYCTHQDVSPKYASTLLGVTNTAASVPGIIGVTAVGALLDQTGDWATALFAPTVLFFVAGAAVYTKYSRSELQDLSNDAPFEWEHRVKAFLGRGKSA